jgi:hypothetical protein
MTEEPWVKPPDPTIESGQYVASLDMSMRLEEYQSRRTDIVGESLRPLPSTREEWQALPLPSVCQHYEPQIAQAREAGPSPAGLRAAASIAAARPVPRPRKSVSLRSSPAPTHKPAKRRVVIWGTAVPIFAGLCVLGGLALYRNQMATRSEFVTAQSAADAPSSGYVDTAVATTKSAPGGMRQADAPSGVQFDRLRSNDIGRRVVDAPTALALPSHPMALGVAPAPKDLERSKAGLIERARTVIAIGDIEGVRANLNRMVESGNASAAVDLGSTYDPNILDALGVRNFPPDVAKARLWYQRAQQMGAPEAVGLLENLESREPANKP